MIPRLHIPGSLRHLARPAVLRHLPHAAWVGAGVVAGVLVLLMFGPTPYSVGGSARASAEWALPGPPLSDAGSTLAERRGGLPPLWASQPAPEPQQGEPTEPPPPPPPELVAVFQSSSGTEAVFVGPDGRRMRSAAGGSLPGGFTVETIDATAVTLRASSGETLRKRLLDQEP